MENMTISPLLFTTTVTAPLELDEHSGAALRGNLFEAVWKRFCVNKDAPSCADCPLHTSCPVSALVAPLREERTRGRDVPRPYIITPPLGGAKRYAPGDSLLFGLTLFGAIVNLLPYIMLSLKALEAAGLGRRVEQNGGKRGSFTIERVEAYHPFTGQRQKLYEAGKTLVEATTLAVTGKDVQERGATLSKERITLNFLTPARLTDHEHLVYHAAFRPLVHRLMERLDALQEAYGEGHSQFSSDRQHYVHLAEHVACVDDATRWEDLSSYSHRTKRFTPIGGLMGHATFAGDLTPFLELLVWGELIRVGKNCVKGDGWYRIET